MERERLRKENQHLRELLNAMHERQRVESKLVSLLTNFKLYNIRYQNTYPVININVDKFGIQLQYICRCQNVGRK